MRRWRKLRALDAGVRWLLVEAAAATVALRFVSYLVSIKVLLRGVERVAARWPVTRRPRLTAEQVGWAVEVAGRQLLGRDSCLVQALAGGLLLARYGHPALVRVGVALKPSRAFAAHAWVECQGRVVVGGGVARAFTALEPVSVTT